MGIKKKKMYEVFVFIFFSESWMISTGTYENTVLKNTRILSLQYFGCTYRTVFVDLRHNIVTPHFFFKDATIYTVINF